MKCAQQLDETPGAGGGGGSPGLQTALPTSHVAVSSHSALVEWTGCRATPCSWSPTRTSAGRPSQASGCVAHRLVGGPVHCWREAGWTPPPVLLILPNVPGCACLHVSFACCVRCVLRMVCGWYCDCVRPWFYYVVLFWVRTCVCVSMRMCACVYAWSCPALKKKTL